MPALRNGSTVDISDDVAKHDITLLVIGEVGDGKSTLVQTLAGCNSGTAGRSAGGKTKTVLTYTGKPINGHPTTLIDTPGVGDFKNKPRDIVKQIEEALISSGRKVDGLIVTTKITDGRASLGAQVVKALVEDSFIAENGGGDADKWRSVILVGTWRDVARSPTFIEEDERTPIEQFVLDKGVVDEYGDPIGTVANFFRSAPSGWGSYALVEKNDYSELEAAIGRLPSIPIGFSGVCDKQLASMLQRVAITSEQQKDLTANALAAKKAALEKKLADDLKRAQDEQREEARRRENEREQQRKKEREAARKKAEEDRKALEAQLAAEKKRQEEAEQQAAERRARAERLAQQRQREFEEEMRRKREAAEVARARERQRVQREAEAERTAYLAQLARQREEEEAWRRRTICVDAIEPRRRTGGFGVTASTGLACKNCAADRGCRWAGEGRPGHR